MSKRKPTPPKTKYDIGDLLAIHYNNTGLAVSRELVVVVDVTDRLYNLQYCDGHRMASFRHHHLESIDGSELGITVDLLARG